MTEKAYQRSLFQLIPPGCVVPCGNATAPPGYLMCDGASYNQSDYPELYAVVGAKFGGSSTSFNVPDLRNQFIRGANEGSRPIGETEGSRIKVHEHQTLSAYSLVPDTYTTVGLDGIEKTGDNQFMKKPNNASLDTAFDNATDTSQFAAEMRPKSLVLAYVVKY